MHRQRLAQRKQVVHYGENRFLDLPGVARAADQDDSAGEVDEDERSRARAFSLRIGLEERRVDDGKLRHEIGDRPFGCDEKMACKKIVPGELGVDAQRHAITFVRADVAVEGVDLSLGEIGGDAFKKGIEAFGVDRLV